jgi:hypothetical protein
MNADAAVANKATRKDLFMSSNSLERFPTLGSGVSPNPARLSFAALVSE